MKNGPCNVGSAPYDPGPLCVQHGGTLVLHVRCHQNQTMLCGGHLTIPCSAMSAGSRPNVAPKRKMAEASLQNLNKPRICSCGAQLHTTCVAHSLCVLHTASVCCSFRTLYAHQPSPWCCDSTVCNCLWHKRIEHICLANSSRLACFSCCLGCCH